MKALKVIKNYWQTAKAQLRVIIAWSIVFAISYLINAGIYQEWSLFSVKLHVALTMLFFTWLIMSLVIHLLNQID